jgi:hypothetical protein
MNKVRSTVIFIVYAFGLTTFSSSSAFGAPLQRLVFTHSHSHESDHHHNSKLQQSHAHENAGHDDAKRSSPSSDHQSDQALPIGSQQHHESHSHEILVSGSFSLVSSPRGIETALIALTSKKERIPPLEESPPSDFILNSIFRPPIA